MPSIVRVGDYTTGHGCHPGRPCITGASTVFANGKAVHRVGDAQDTHCCGSDCHDSVTVGQGRQVFVEGKEIAFVGYSTTCGDTLAQGSPDTTSTQ